MGSKRFIEIITYNFLGFKVKEKVLKSVDFRTFYGCGGGTRTYDLWVMRPEILFSDEPTGNLDSKTSDEVIALLKMSAKKYGQTIVMITHDDEIAQVADRILVIEDGQVVDFN